jgi:DNA helicase HerA-like ATPase
MYVAKLQKRLQLRQGVQSFLMAQATSALSTRQSANVLVLLDEAHRHAPSGRLDEDSEADRLRSLLRRAGVKRGQYGMPLP